MELKPCPFCGGEARPESYLADGTRYFYVQCSKCWVEQDERCLREQASFEAWNKRFPDSDDITNEVLPNTSQVES